MTKYRINKNLTVVELLCIRIILKVHRNFGVGT